MKDVQEQGGLATELLREVKASAKRWFIAFCVMVGLEVGTITGFLIYLSLPIEDEMSIEQNADAKENSSVTQSVIGGDNYESETDSEKIQEESR